MKKYCTMVIFLLTGLLLGLGALIYYYESITLSADHTYTVERGLSLHQIANDLHQKGIIEHPLALVALASITGHAADVKSGEYFFEKNSSLSAVLQKMVKGDVVMHHLRIGEGWTFAHIAQQIQAHPAIQLTLDWSKPQTILQQLKLDTRAPEGLFYPDTYYFPRGYSDAAFLTRAYQEMQFLLKAAWKDRSLSLPYSTPYEALIAASIIEKETAVATEREEIAGVIARRLQRRMPLQVDPTVIYGLGADYSKALTHADLNHNTPYNTYVHLGLPPTPIAIPSPASIYAALHPQSGTTLYFVAKGDGSHTFSSTLEAHNQAVQAYREQNKK